MQMYMWREGRIPWREVRIPRREVRISGPRTLRQSRDALSQGGEMLQAEKEVVAREVLC